MLLKSIPANIVSWLGKTVLMPNYWSSRFVLQWMSIVRNREIRNMVILDQYFQFSVSLMYNLKNYCIVYLYTQTSQIVCFCCDRKILWWIGSGDFKFSRTFFNSTEMYPWINIWKFEIILSSKSSREDMCRLPTSFVLNIQSRVKQEVDIPQIQNCVTRYTLTKKYYSKL